MGAPTSHTEATIRQYMVDELDATGVALGLTIASAGIVKASNDQERVVGAAIAAQTDMAKAEAIAAWIAWRTALGAATGDRDLKAGTSALTASQRFDHILTMLRDAENAASAYSEVAAILAGSGGTAYVSGMQTAGSPYAYGWPYDEWGA